MCEGDCDDRNRERQNILLCIFVANVFLSCNLPNLWIFPAMEFDPDRLEFKARV